MAKIPAEVLLESPDNDSRLWVVIPAGGTGSRMGGPPKQYRPLGGSTVIEQTMQPFLSRGDMAGIVLCLSEHDLQGRQIAATLSQCHVADAGTERSDSVLNGLRWLVDTGTAKPNDWVLVHDAARPCLPAADLKKLIDCCCAAGNGGLLALPVRDTLKYSADNKLAEKTIDRSPLWQALTPQMFPLAQLHHALVHCAENQLSVTDEASAIEQLGHRPQLVVGSALNLKVTWPGDLEIAERLLPLARTEP